jgi:hypothetical protein
VVILESAAATVLVLGSVLILRACWKVDSPRHVGVVRRRRIAHPKTVSAEHRRAA